jgi:ribosomal protein S12 methylthiotransferase
LGVFTYSHEENTHAYTLVDDVPDDVKKKRAEEIMAMQGEISRALNQGKIGKQFKVLIDRKEGDWYIGRTEFDSPDVDNEVYISATEKKLRIGDFVLAEILSAEEYDLVGRVVG